MTQTAYEPVREFWFTPKESDGSDAAQRYKVRSLDGMETMELMADMRIDDSDEINISGKALKRAVKLGLKDWENLTESDGRPIVFVRSNFGRVPPGHLTQIATAVISNAELSEDERKNLSSQSK